MKRNRFQKRNIIKHVGLIPTNTEIETMLSSMNVHFKYHIPFYRANHACAIFIQNNVVKDIGNFEIFNEVLYIFVSNAAAYESASQVLLTSSKSKKQCFLDHTVLFSFYYYLHCMSSFMCEILKDLQYSLHLICVSWQP